MTAPWTMLAPAPVGPLGEGRTPTFSVLIAAFQVADVIGQAVGSALAQTEPAAEIIVCDDGSTDDLEGALAPFARTISFVRRDTNGGESAAKNTAAAAATGEFLVILDADDVFEPERLAALGWLARQRPDLDVLTTDAILEVDGRPVRRCYTPENPFEVDDQRSEILQRNFVFGLAAVRRQAFHDAGGFDESIRRTADWDLWIRMIHAGSRVGLVADPPLARYRVRQASLSGDRVGMARGGLQTLEKAQSLPSLSTPERQALVSGIAAQRRKLLEREARAALLSGTTDARRLSFSVARDGSFGLPTRAKAAGAAIAPRLAGRLLRRGGWTGAGDVRATH